MTFEELEERIKQLMNKRHILDCILPCTLFDNGLDGQFYIDGGLRVLRNQDLWEVHWNFDRRPDMQLEAYFCLEHDCYEYVYFRFIRYFDECTVFGHMWPGKDTEWFKRKMKRHKIPNSAYSLNGGMTDDCLCIEKKEDTWEVYYSNSGEKTVLGVLYDESLAYNYLLYLLMKKYVDSKKHWWKRYTGR